MMNSHADKTQQNKSAAVANNLSLQQDARKNAFQLTDDQSHLTNSEKLREIANNNPRVNQLRAYQEMANKNRHVKQLKSPSQNNFNASSPIQLKRGLTQDETEKLNEHAKLIDHCLDVLSFSSSIPPHLPEGFSELLNETEELIYECLDSNEVESTFTLEYIDQEMQKLETVLDKAKEKAPQYRSYAERDSFALYKLLGNGEEKNFDLRTKLLKSATKATIYKNGEVDPGGLGTLLTIKNDFPGIVYCNGSEVSVVNILGSGRLKEAKSYLEEVGINNIVIADLGEEPSDIIENKIIKAKNFIAGKNVSLSIMPLSTLAQASRKKGVKILWSEHIGGNTNYQFEVVYVNEKIHFVADIRWANGTLVENLLEVLQGWGVALDSVNLYGIAGSLIDGLGPDTLVVPRGEIHSLDPEHKEPVSIPWNDAFIPGAMLTMDHGNVSSILEETDEGVRDLLLYKEIHVVEMEAYHLVKKLESMDYSGNLKIVFKIHDVITSPHENISIPVPQNAETLIAKQERDKIILEAFEIL